MARAERELLAAREEVWRFLSEPHHLPDWWPGVVAVEPDRRGFAVGARWRVQRREPQLRLLPLPSSDQLGRLRAETLVVERIDPPAALDFRIVGQGLGGRARAPLVASLRLDPARAGRTLARLELDSGRLAGRRDARAAAAALARLHALLQTAAAL